MVYDTNQLDEILVFQNVWFHKKALWQFMFATADQPHNQPVVFSPVPIGKQESVFAAGFKAALAHPSIVFGESIEQRPDADGDVFVDADETGDDNEYSDEEDDDNGELNTSEGLSESRLASTVQLTQIISIFNVNQLKLETDFGKVIGRTELVMREFGTHGVVTYDTPRVYLIHALVGDITISDKLRRLGVLGGTVQLAGVTVGAYTCDYYCSFIEICIFRAKAVSVSKCRGNTAEMHDECDGREV